MDASSLCVKPQHKSKSDNAADTQAATCRIPYSSWLEPSASQPETTNLEKWITQQDGAANKGLVRKEISSLTEKSGTEDAATDRRVGSPSIPMGPESRDDGPRMGIERRRTTGDMDDNAALLGIGGAFTSEQPSLSNGNTSARHVQQPSQSAGRFSTTSTSYAPDVSEHQLKSRC